MPGVILLGPQRLAPTVGDEIAAMADFSGSVAMITSGWQEREDEDEEFRSILGVPAINLRLYSRWEDIRSRAPAYFAAHRQRQDRLRHLRRLYQQRLNHLMAAAAELLDESDARFADLLAAERTNSVAAIQDLDSHYLQKVREINVAFHQENDPGAQPEIVSHRNAIQDQLKSCEVVAMAGGHIAVLLNRLRVFALGPLLRERTVFAWSAGAMALTERVVLFHDHPPQGAGNAELFDRGLGLVPGVVVLPSARHRLALSDDVRVSMLARRLQPAICVPMDEKDRLCWAHGHLVPGDGLRQLGVDGTVQPMEGR